MDLKTLGRHWNAWGEQDAMYAVLTDPSKRRNGWDHDEFFATGRLEIDGVLKYLSDLNAMPCSNDALDFGCGVGRLSQALADTFDSVVGVDIAPSMVTQAERYNRFPGRCRYIVNAANDLSQFSTGTFDFVYCNIVLQHMRPDYAAGYIREFFRLLRPEGIAIFFLPAAAMVGPTRALPLRQRLKIATRSWLNRSSIAFLGRVAFPQIEMFGTPLMQAKALIAECGGRLLDVVADGSAGEDWIGYRYCCGVAMSSPLTAHPTGLTVGGLA